MFFAACKEPCHRQVDGGLAFDLSSRPVLFIMATSLQTLAEWVESVSSGTSAIPWHLEYRRCVSEMGYSVECNAGAGINEFRMLSGFTQMPVALRTHNEHLV